MAVGQWDNSAVADRRDRFPVVLWWKAKALHSCQLKSSQSLNCDLTGHLGSFLCQQPIIQRPNSKSSCFAFADTKRRRHALCRTLCRGGDSVATCGAARVGTALVQHGSGAVGPYLEGALAAGEIRSSLLRMRQNRC